MFLFFVVVAKKGGLILESNVSKSTVCAEVGKGGGGGIPFSEGGLLTVLLFVVKSICYNKNLVHHYVWKGFLEQSFGLHLC